MHGNGGTAWQSTRETCSYGVPAVDRPGVSLRPGDGRVWTRCGGRRDCRGGRRRRGREGREGGILCGGRRAPGRRCGGRGAPESCGGGSRATAGLPLPQRMGRKPRRLGSADPRAPQRSRKYADHQDLDRASGRARRPLHSARLHRQECLRRTGPLHRPQLGQSGHVRGDPDPVSGHSKCSISGARIATRTQRGRSWGTPKSDAFRMRESAS